MSKFYTNFKKTAKKSRLSQKQVDTIDTIFFEMDESDCNISQRAIILATTELEAAYKWTPVYETLASTPMEAVRRLRKHYKRKVGTKKDYFSLRKYKGRMHTYLGRSLIQLTWLSNYIRIGKLLKLPLAEKPELAMDIKVSAKILVSGMMQGWFTKYSIKNLPNQASFAQYRNTRRVVNGMNKASKIAKRAQIWEKFIENNPYPNRKNDMETIKETVADTKVADTKNDTVAFPDIPKEGAFEDVKSPTESLTIRSSLISMVSIIIGALLTMLGVPESIVASVGESASNIIVTVLMVFVPVFGNMGAIMGRMKASSYISVH